MQTGRSQRDKSRTSLEIAQVEPEPTRGKGVSGPFDLSLIERLIVVAGGELAEPFPQLAEVAQPAFIRRVDSSEGGVEPLNKPEFSPTVSKDIVSVRHVMAVEERHETGCIGLP